MIECLSTEILHNDVDRWMALCCRETIHLFQIRRTLRLLPIYFREPLSQNRGNSTATIPRELQDHEMFPYETKLKNIPTHRNKDVSHEFHSATAEPGIAAFSVRQGSNIVHPESKTQNPGLLFRLTVDSVSCGSLHEKSPTSITDLSESDDQNLIDSHSLNCQL
jgi:hypothetical protein